MDPQTDPANKGGPSFLWILVRGLTARRNDLTVAMSVHPLSSEPGPCLGCDLTGCLPDCVAGDRISGISPCHKNADRRLRLS